MIRLAHLVIAAALAVPAAAPAQSLLPCTGRVAGAQNMMGPDFQRSYANGNIRIIGLDAQEPATGWAYLMVTTRVTGQPGESCAIVARQGTTGFSGMRPFSQMDARYDAQTGLTISALMQVPNGSAGFFWQSIAITVNQATGAITARPL